MAEDFSVKVEGLDRLRLAFGRVRERALEAMGQTCLAMAKEIGNRAQVSVPRQSGELADSFFVDGPAETRKGGRWATTGYKDAKAPAVHEGIHWGIKLVNPPPKWLEHAAEGRGEEFRDLIRATLESVLR